MKLKIMPESPAVDLGEVEVEVKKVIESFEGKVNASGTEDVAFTLKALILAISWPDEAGSEELEKSLLKLKGVGSVQILDVRKSL